MDLSLQGKRAIVAGASSGLGLATARLMATEGARVALGGHRQERLEAAVAAIGPSAHGVLADLREPGAGARFVDEAVAALGGVDILVVNGPGPAPGTFASTPPDAYQEALDAVLLPVVQMCQQAVPRMVDQGWGRVVAITSVGVRQPLNNLILSNTARAGATGFLKSVATEVAPHGVTVNSVLPGLHRTDRLAQVYGEGLGEVVEQIPMRTLGRPEDLAAAVAFLCSEQARFITGTTLTIDGGQVASLI